MFHLHRCTHRLVSLLSSHILLLSLLHWGNIYPWKIPKHSDPSAENCNSRNFSHDIRCFNKVKLLSLLIAMQVVISYNARSVETTCGTASKCGRVLGRQCVLYICCTCFGIHWLPFGSFNFQSKVGLFAQPGYSNENLTAISGTWEGWADTELTSTSTGSPGNIPKVKDTEVVEKTALINATRSSQHTTGRNVSLKTE